ncbi:MAG: FecR domain-containing protein [Holophagaceae bacterium]|uniref:FecR domain-containing protein n=1 Tax=Candidatus Geothrix skivensis TaxID=2954439 RepID=A0A9D7SIE5_9BACT|nr:FecR domain-containing protein [Candidatus Geothrix skivensis]
MNAHYSHSRLAALLCPAVLLVAAPQAPPTSAPTAYDEETYQGEAPERYAMVRALEGEVQIRKGDLDERLSRGTPIAEGDVVESRGRGVLQLGDGTRVAFGGATRFTVGALFTDRKGEKQVLLRLDYGRLHILLGGQSDARFRVDTPSGTATCFNKGAFTVEAERDRLVRLKVQSGRVAFANERDETRVSAGERLTVYSPQDGLDRVRSYNTYDGDDFDRWSERAMQVKRGESWDRVPAELRYYADELDGHGRWVHSDEFGWVWQPAGVAEDWRPYYQGRWAPYSGGMTWVSEEPWAYVAYHHGRWHWGVGLGWCWIPGIHYSPAWVAWNNTPGYYGWAPLGYYNTPCHWGYGAWGGGYAWNVVSINFINYPRIHTRVYSDVHIIRTFNGGRDGRPWNGGDRSLQAPWQRSPLIVSSREFRNPTEITTAFRRDVHRERMGAYERQAQTTTGRVVLRRELTPPSGGGQAPQGGGSVRRPFEERRPASAPERFVPRERPIEPQPRGEERRPDVVPRERSMEPKPRVEERRPDVVPRERSMEPKPRVEERRPDVVPRERPMEPKPRVEERRPDLVPRERQMEPKPRMEERRPDVVPRERPMEFRPRVEPERRPDPPAKVERENRPAPKPEPPREKPREEKRSTAVHGWR